MPWIALVEVRHPVTDEFVEIARRGPFDSRHEAAVAMAHLVRKTGLFPAGQPRWRTSLREEP